MNEFPRLALATSAEDPEPSVACLAMLAGLTERDGGGCSTSARGRARRRRRRSAR